MMPDIDPTLLHAQKFGETLTTPVFVVDPEGTLLFYNEPAGVVLGRKFDETGSMPASTWSRLFLPTDESGVPLLPEQLPLIIALQEHRPAYGRIWVRGIDNVQRAIAISAFPITNEKQDVVGAVAFFWEVEKGA
jgi:PAS domain-containing protein